MRQQTQTKKTDVDAMRRNFKQTIESDIKKLENISRETGWKDIQTVNGTCKTHIEQAMDKFHLTKTDTDPRDFFTAWAIPASVIAERLRRLGWENVKGKEIENIMHDGIKNTDQRYLLSIAMMEMRNDITKTLYGD